MTRSRPITSIGRDLVVFPACGPAELATLSRLVDDGVSATEAAQSAALIG
ncbi:hypothetical protein AB0395_31450 [Streptosporangium sp. NPDC051023]